MNSHIEHGVKTLKFSDFNSDSAAAAWLCDGGKVIKALGAQLDHLQGRIIIISAARGGVS